MPKGPTNTHKGAGTVIAGVSADSPQHDRSEEDPQPMRAQVSHSPPSAIATGHAGIQNFSPMPGVSPLLPPRVTPLGAPEGGASVSLDGALKKAFRRRSRDAARSAAVSGRSLPSKIGVSAGIERETGLAGALGAAVFRRVWWRGA